MGRVVHEAGRTDCRTFKGIQTAGNTQGLGVQLGFLNFGYHTCQNRVKLRIQPHA